VVILGVDPGLRFTGYGALKLSGPPGPGVSVSIVEAGVFKLPPKASISDRLVELATDFGELLGRVQPQAVAVEMLYAHYKHPVTAIIMGHARGVLLHTIRKHNLRLVELRPTEVKKSVTGHGHAAKPQIQAAVQAEFRLAQPPEPPDIADALAIALCASRRAAWAEDMPPELPDDDHDTD
jgi:crossover junction endodeoxyribonuclease RuvC